MRQYAHLLLIVPCAFIAACSTLPAWALESAFTSTPDWSYESTLQPVWPTDTALTPDMTQGLLSVTPMSGPSLIPTDTGTPAGFPTPSLTQAPPTAVTPTLTPSPSVPSIMARVAVGLLSCRYGPGPEYLYLYALRQDANIELIGRVDSDNWHWAWVAGANRCWVNITYLAMEGDWRQLPVVYPGTAGLPISPYYPPTSIVSVVRSGAAVTVEWVHIPLRAGDEEDESMQHYILEVWHCVNGSILFEPLATNETLVTVMDEPGCTAPSRARLFVQEKHGFSGPTLVAWPAAR